MVSCKKNMFQLSSVLLVTLALVYEGTGQQTYNMELIGNINSRLYFLDRNLTGTWEQMRYYCENQGMQLANFGTATDANHVHEGLLALGVPFDYFWTGGVDRTHNISTFYWRYSNSSSGSINPGLSIVSSQPESFAAMALRVIRGVESGFVTFSQLTQLPPICVLLT